MFALDREDIATREDKRMHRAKNGNNTIQDVTQFALPHCDGLGSSLQAMMRTFSEYHNALSNAYDAHASINENSNSSGLW